MSTKFSLNAVYTGVKKADIGSICSRIEKLNIGSTNTGVKKIDICLVNTSDKKAVIDPIYQKIYLLARFLLHSERQT